MIPTMRTLGLALASSALFLASCASPTTMRQYQDEVRSLREERTQLKKENRDLRSQCESYEAQLAEASVKVQEAPAPATNPEFDALGIDYYTDRYGNSVISVASDITFASGKAELTKDGKTALQAVARELNERQSAGAYWIEGHTDNDPIVKSKWGSNRELSVARAMAVLHFLVEACNVPDDKCIVAGHGQYQPIAANDDKAGKARNRRVAIVIRK